MEGVIVEKLPQTVLPFLQYGAFGLLAIMVLAGMFLVSKLLTMVVTGIVTAMQDISKTQKEMRDEVVREARASEAVVRAAQVEIVKSVHEARDAIIREVRNSWPGNGGDDEPESRRGGSAGGPDDTGRNRRRR